jgi:hypothetical protein
MNDDYLGTLKKGWWQYPSYHYYSGENAETLRRIEQQDVDVDHNCRDSCCDPDLDIMALISWWINISISIKSADGRLVDEGYKSIRSCLIILILFNFNICLI